MSKTKNANGQDGSNTGQGSYVPPPIVRTSFDDYQKIVGNLHLTKVAIHKVEENDFWGEELDSTYMPPIYRRWSYNTKRNRSQYHRQYRKKFYYWGDDNRFPHFLLHLFGQSTTLRSALQATMDTAYGRGKVVGGGAERDIKAFTAWLKQIKADYKFDQLLFKNAVLFEGGYVELAYGAEADGNGGNKGKLTCVKGVLATKYRIGVRNDAGEVNHYFYHRDYNCKRLDYDKLRAIVSYKNPEEGASSWDQDSVFDWDLNTPKYKREENLKYNKGRRVYEYHMDSPLSDEYPVARWTTEGAINAAMINYTINQFDLAGMENGLSVGHIVVVPLMQPPRGDEAAKAEHERQKQAIRADIQQNMQGAENADNVVVLYVDPRAKDDPIRVVEVPHNNNAETLQDKDERAERTLMTAFQVTHPALIGIPPRNGKGLTSQSNVLNEAEGIWYTSFISPYVIHVQAVYDKLVEIWEYENGRELGSSGLRVSFPRNTRFKARMSDSLMLKVLPTRLIWEEFGIEEPYTEEVAEELLMDLIARQNPASLTETEEEDEEVEPVDPDEPDELDDPDEEDEETDE